MANNTKIVLCSYSFSSFTLMPKIAPYNLPIVENTVNQLLCASDLFSLVSRVGKESQRKWLQISPFIMEYCEDGHLLYYLYIYKCKPKASYFSNFNQSIIFFNKKRFVIINTDWIPFYYYNWCQIKTDLLPQIYAIVTQSKTIPKKLLMLRGKMGGRVYYMQKMNDIWVQFSSTSIRWTLNLTLEIGYPALMNFCDWFTQKNIWILTQTFHGFGGYTS